MEGSPPPAMCVVRVACADLHHHLLAGGLPGPHVPVRRFADAQVHLQPIAQYVAARETFASGGILPSFYAHTTNDTYLHGTIAETIMAQKPKDKSSVDAIPFVVGVITLLKQFHSVYTQQFLAYLGQYVRSLINITVGGYSSLPALFLSPCQC
jgi:hypothetical protein